MRTVLALCVLFIYTVHTRGQFNSLLSITYRALNIEHGSPQGHLWYGVSLISWIYHNFWLLLLPFRLFFFLNDSQNKHSNTELVTDCHHIGCRKYLKTGFRNFTFSFWKKVQWPFWQKVPTENLAESTFWQKSSSFSVDLVFWTTKLLWYFRQHK